MKRREFVAIACASAVAGCQTGESRESPTESPTSTRSVTSTEAPDRPHSVTVDGVEVEFLSASATAYIVYADGSTLERLEPENEWWVRTRLHVTNLTEMDRTFPGIVEFDAHVDGERYPPIAEFDEIDDTDVREDDDGERFLPPHLPGRYAGRTMGRGAMEYYEPLFDVGDGTELLLSWDQADGVKLAPRR